MVRAKQRYILCEIIQDPRYQTPVTLEEEAIYLSLREAIKVFHGDYGAGILQRSLRVKYWNNDTKIVLIRAKRGSHVKVIQAMTLMKKVAEIDAFFRTLHVSATIRSCQKFLVKHQKRELVASLHQCKTSEDKKSMRKLIEECEHSCQQRAQKVQKNKPFFPLSIDSSDEESES